MNRKKQRRTDIQVVEQYRGYAICFNNRNKTTKNMATMCGLCVRESVVSRTPILFSTLYNTNTMDGKGKALKNCRAFIDNLIKE